MTSNPPEKTNLQKVLDFIQPFWIGGLSGMVATTVIQPVDMIKTVIQLKSEEISKTHDPKQKANFLSAFRDINKKEGMKGFYRGFLLSYVDLTQHWSGKFFIRQPEWECIRLSPKRFQFQIKRKDRVKTIIIKVHFHFYKNVSVQVLLDSLAPSLPTLQI